MPPASSSRGWLAALRRYFVVLALGDVLWEPAQLPLYTLWQEASPGLMVRAVLHCIAGDLVIGMTVLIAALMLYGKEAWPTDRHTAVMIGVVTIGYTVASEYLNTVVRGSWAYGPAMPSLPLVGTGLAPLAQWITIPIIALVLARSRKRSAQRWSGDVGR